MRPPTSISIPRIYFVHLHNHSVLISHKSSTRRNPISHAKECLQIFSTTVRNHKNKNKKGNRSHKNRIHKFQAEVKVFEAEVKDTMQKRTI